MTSVQALPSAHQQHITIPPNQVPLAGFPVASATELDANANVPRGPVTTVLTFYDSPKDGAAPFNYVEEPPSGLPQRNFGGVDHEVTLNDARGREQDFELDRQAFTALKGHPHNPAIDWNDDDSVKRVYYPEVERILLENAPGANRILIFDHTIRRADPKAHRGPVTRTHIDQTAKSAAQRVSFHLPDEAEKLLKGRYRIINVWRPLNGAVESHPLAFADSATVPDDDMVGIEHRYPDRTGETAGVKHNPNHAWYYWSGMENDERLLLQCFDSKLPNNRVPHSAFVDPRSTNESKPRESIEVRALVFG